MSYGYDKQNNYYVKFPEKPQKVNPVTDKDKDKEKADKIRDAFAYDGEKTKAASRDLQYEYVIDKPLFYTFNIPKTGTAGTKKTGTGDYGTGRKDDYVAEYDAKGRLVKITAKNSQFGTTTVTYTYNDKGEMTETSVNDKVGSKSVTEYNKDGTTKTHAEWLTDEDGKFPKKPVLKREYSYDLDSKGNPVEKIQYTAGSNVTLQTTLNTDGTYTQKNYYTGTETVIGKAAAKSKQTTPTTTVKPVTQDPVTLNPSGTDKQVTYKDVFGYDSAIAKKQGIASDKSDVVNLPLFYQIGAKTTSKANSTAVKTLANKDGGQDQYTLKYDKSGKLVSISKKTINGKKNIVGPETKYTYSSNGEIMETTESSKTKEVVVYNPNGSLKAITTFTKDDKGDLKQTEKKEYEYTKGKDGSLTQIMNSTSGVHATATYTAEGKYVFASSISYTKPQTTEETLKKAFGSDFQAKLYNTRTGDKTLPYAATIENDSFVSWNGKIKSTINPKTESRTQTGSYTYSKGVGHGDVGLAVEEEVDYTAKYDSQGRIIEVSTSTHKKSANNNFENATYSYASNGDITEKYKTGSLTRVTVYDKDGKVKSYKEYNNQGVLQKANEYSYSVDDKGNAIQKVKTKSGEVITTTMNTKGVYSQKSDKSGTTQTRTTHDAAYLFKSENGTFVLDDSITNTRKYFDKSGNEASSLFNMKNKETWDINSGNLECTFNGKTTNGKGVYGKLVVDTYNGGVGTLDGKPVTFDVSTGLITFKNASDEKNARSAITATLDGKVSTYKVNGKEYNVIKETEV
ncbi:hypothetical protein II906_06945, partial [bacterium]|nr:hypothetical protein [bacterium]